MRSNPTAAFDKSSQAQFHLLASQATSKLNKLAIKHTSKRNAKKDKQSVHKAKAWLCHKPSVSRIVRATEKSKIDWI
jgi:hypothetical protein